MSGKYDYDRFFLVILLTHIFNLILRLSGMIFKENNSNYKIGIRELEKIINIYFDKSGFPKSRNPEEVFICIKYLILIR